MKLNDYQLLQRSIYKDSYYHFLVDFWDEVESKSFKDNPHIKYLCDEVQIVFKWAADFELQQSPYDILINVPPGTTKSSIISKFGPAYLWALNPDVQQIASSYSSIAVKSFTSKFKRLMNSDKFLEIYPELKLEIENVGEQSNFHKGVRYTTSTNGSVTGIHADLIIIDDHNKPPKVERDESGNPKLTAGATLTEIISGNSWHDDVLTTRKTDKELTRSIYVQQRVHERDLSGYILRKAKKGGVDLKHINLPAEIFPDQNKLQAFAKIYRGGNIVEEEDLSHLYTDNLLDATRMNKSLLERQRKLMSTHVYNAQFLQSPSPDRGGIIKTEWFDVVDANEVPDNLVKFFYTDPSEGKKNSDNMATVCWSLWENKVYIWEVMAIVAPFNEFIGRRTETGEYVDKKYDLFVKRHGQNWQSKHFFEAKSTGTPYIQYINSATSYNAIPDKPEGSKMDRVSLSLPTLEAKRIKLIKGDWIQDFLEECRLFSGRDNDVDDRVDVLTGLVKLTDFNGSIFISEKSEKLQELTF